MTPRWWIVGACCIWTLARPAAAFSQCIEVVDDTAAPKVSRPEVDVRQVIQLTGQGKKALDPQSLVYVEITRAAGQDRVGGRALIREEQRFIRILDRPELKVPFTFSRQGTHRLRALTSTVYSWPEPPTLETMTALCPGESVSIDVVEPQRRTDFPGVRGQWWGAYLIPSRVELGSALFIRRLGFAGTMEVALTRAIGDRDDPKNINPVVGRFEVRYRGSRGYLGGGFRYYPDDEPDRDRMRFGAFAGEELPSFKGRPIWLLLDLTLEDRRENFVKGLRPTFGVRFDLWGSQP